MQTIQYIHFSIEMWGALFSLVGALIVFLTRYFDKAGSRKLMMVLFCSALLMFSDGIAWLYRGNTTEAAYYIVRISSFTSSFFGFLIIPLAAQYVSHLIYVRTNGVRLYWEIYEWGIFLFGSALLIINAFVPFIYTFDETNTYERLPYFFWVPGFIALVGALIMLFASSISCCVYGNGKSPQATVASRNRTHASSKVNPQLAQMSFACS